MYPSLSDQVSCLGSIGCKIRITKTLGYFTVSGSGQESESEPHIEIHGPHMRFRSCWKFLLIDKESGHEASDDHDFLGH